MITAGVDLAAEPKKTAVAVIEWTHDRAVVRDLVLNADDASIVDVVRAAHKTGIDCPFGWPDRFVDFVSAHRGGNSHEALDASDATWRRTLCYRATDEVVRQELQKVPLSVSTDRIGVTTLRCARLLSTMATDKVRVDRSGVSGAVVEVYPAASMRRWRLWETLGTTFPYKGRINVGGLTKIAGWLERSQGWLDLGANRELFYKSDDAFDAVICALTARAVNTGLWSVPSKSQRSVGRIEGWIALPTGELSDLMNRGEK